jgi:hypothetical protein
MMPRPSSNLEMLACCHHPTQGHLTLAGRDKRRSKSMKASSPKEGHWDPYHLLRPRQGPGLAPSAPGKIASIVDVIVT